MWRPHPSLVSIAIVVFISLQSGCASFLGGGKWPTPRLDAPDYDLLSQRVSVRSGSLSLMRANLAYGKAVAAMECGEPECVDHFFEAAHFAWCDIRGNAKESCLLELPSVQVYRSALNALIVQGQRYQRLDPVQGLRIRTRDGWIDVPCQFYGFANPPQDISNIVPVGDYSKSHLNQLYRQEGVGVPVILAQNRPCPEVFQRKQSSMAATIVLRTEGDDFACGGQPCAIEIHDPLVASSVCLNDLNAPMAYDKSAPIARALMTTKRNYLQAFLQPGNVTPSEQGLFLLEPYAAGKIPVVFVHGLLSDRLTWANLVNEIKSRPWFHDRFQIWGFEYPTGKPFLSSAALLRAQLAQLCGRLDPDDTEPALKQVVLVGHSMGGLISKTQISSSQDTLWRSISNRRFDNVTMAPLVRERLADAMFFEPVSRVNRVIYIGTPHRGSAWAQRVVGRVGGLLIQQTAELSLQHRKLLDENPETFSSEFTRRIPNSLDLLEPDSPLLLAIDRMPIAPHVRTHSIIGSGRWMPGNGDSDGVVPVSSARQVTADSEKFVGEKHAELTSDPHAIDEVLSILREHNDTRFP